MGMPLVYLSIGGLLKRWDFVATPSVADYHNLKVPKPLMNRLEELIEEQPELGYRSGAEAAIEAIRNQTRDLEERLEEERKG